MASKPLPPAPRFPLPFPFLPAAGDDSNATRLEAYVSVLTNALPPPVRVCEDLSIVDLISPCEQAIDRMPEPSAMDCIDWYYCASLQSLLGFIWFVKGHLETACTMYRTAWTTLDAIDPKDLQTREQRVVLRQKIIEVKWGWDRARRACELMFSFGSRIGRLTDSIDRL